MKNCIDFKLPYFIVCNWKENGDIKLCKSISTMLSHQISKPSSNLLTELGIGTTYSLKDPVYLLFATPDIYLMYLKNCLNEIKYYKENTLAESDIMKLLWNREVHPYICAQSISRYVSGAHTGETSIKFLSDIGCDFAIIGHAETRLSLNDSDEIVGFKAGLCFANCVTPIICIGEPLDVYLNERSAVFLREQLWTILYNMSLTYSDIVATCTERDKIDDYNSNNTLLIAYEPLWAIGSDQTLKFDFIESIIVTIYDIIADFNDRTFPIGTCEPSLIFRKIRVLYGGAVNEENYTAITNIEKISGVLIGRASLDPEVLSKIILMS